jgi:hypothetical protein
MAFTATANLSLVYSPPSGPVNSVTATMATACVHNAQNVGVLDVPAGTSPSTVFPIPFGSVSSAKLLVIKNTSNDEIGVQLNSSASDIYRISAGGFMAIGMSSDPTADAVTDATVTWINAAVSLQTIQFWVFGD